MFRDLVLKNRSYRRFDASQPIDRQTLVQLVDLARFIPSGRNLQPLKYLIAYTPERNHLIFACLSWAGYLKDWGGPAENERPTGYIIVLGDKRLASGFGIDPGIAAQTILLGAVERGLGGCMIGSINRPLLASSLGLSDHYEILLVLALGRPVERVVLEPVEEDGNIRYYRDEDGTHHVPKRGLDEVLIE
jgi:nitroreductase